MNVANRRMTVDEFLDWAQAQPRGRFELIAGEIVEKLRERVLHARTKLEVALVLRQALAAAGLSGYQVYPEGMTVRVDVETAFEPDCALEARGLTPDDAVELTAPLLVVEVLSPSTSSVDGAASSPDISRSRASRTISSSIPASGSSRTTGAPAATSRNPVSSARVNSCSIRRASRSTSRISGRRR